MNIRDLEYLVAISDHRHFGRAAAACLISQPTLSTQLKKLERELGVPLIERGIRQVLLTKAGEEIVAHARKVLTEVSTIQGIADRAKDPRTGSIRLGLFPTLGPYLLPHLMGPLRRQLPDLKLHIVEEQSPLVTDRLRLGQLDAALLAIPAADPQLAFEPVFTEEFVAALPAAHPLATAEGPLTPSMLATEGLLLLSKGHCLRDQTLEVCGEASPDGPVRVEASSLETLRHMVGASLGVSLLPRMAVSAPVPASPEVVLREFSQPRPSRTIGLYWRPGSVYEPVLHEIAAVLRTLPDALVTSVPAEQPTAS